MNHQEFIPGFRQVKQFVLLGLCSHVQASDRIFLMVKHSVFPQVSSCAPKENKKWENHLIKEHCREPTNSREGAILPNFVSQKSSEILHSLQCVIKFKFDPALHTTEPPVQCSWEFSWIFSELSGVWFLFFQCKFNTYNVLPKSVNKNGLGYHAQSEEKQWPVSPELKKASFKTGWLMKAQQQTKFKCKESIQSQARYLSLFFHVTRVSLDHRCFFV